MTSPLGRGSVIGILGGGQLGRMLSMAAARLGIRTHIFEPSANPPAADVAWRLTTADYDNTAALVDFAESVDVITYEFENIPASALDVLERMRPVYPSRQALEISQDRLREKTFLQSLGLNVAPFRAAQTEQDLQKAIAELGTPAILKTTRLGYDGKGQVRIMDAGEAGQAIAAMDGAPAVLEAFVDFDREISVIAARGMGGAIVCYDPGENTHKNGILDTTRVPAQLAPGEHMQAVLLAGNILNALDYVGVMGVELFVTTSGLIVNEIAPRVHNSGHWTQNGCVIDQFEQHIRAIAGWPLGDAQRHSDVVMTNLIGDDVRGCADTVNAALHIYGKHDIKPGRKMGHVNVVTPKA